MTIISILLAFTLCHLLRDLGRLRRFGWITGYTRQCNSLLKGLPGWAGPVGFLVLVGLPLVVLYLANSVMIMTLGHLGEFLLSIAILIYTFGPRDLDVDVSNVIHARDDEEQRAALEELLDGPVPEDRGACQTAVINAVFSKALRRWFAIIFWFAVIGVYGALLYRLASWMSEGDYGLHEGQKDLLVRLNKIMDWPVAQLITLAMAIATDFDSVYHAWKQYHGERGHGLLEGNNDFMLTSARTIVMSGHAENDGYADQLRGHMATIKLSMDLVWRLLGVWATVLALLLLVNVIS